MPTFFGQEFDSVETGGQEIVDIPLRMTVEHCERMEEHCAGQLSLQEAVRATSNQTVEVLRSEVKADDLEAEVADPIAERLQAIERYLEEGVAAQLTGIEPDLRDGAVEGGNGD
jgi:hypothetical protein